MDKNEKNLCLPKEDFDKEMNPPIDNSPYIDYSKLYVEVKIDGFGMRNTHICGVRKDVWEKILKELKELRHHRDSTIGLWATDQDYKTTINKAIFDGTKSIHWFDDQEVRKETGLAVINSIEEEFKRVMFQIK